MAGITVGILGVGRLGEALAKAVLSHPDVGSLYISRRSAERAERLVQYDARVKPADPEQIVASCDHLVISLRPGAARSVLPTLKFESRHCVISAMAEVNYRELQALTRGASSVSRLLVLPAVVNGKQVLPVYPASPSATQLFGHNNKLFTVSSEDELLSFWSITGLLSVVMMVGEVAADWMIESGIDPQQANTYSRVLFSEAYMATSEGITSGIEHVSTPGGLNAMAYKEMKRNGYDVRLKEITEHIFDRLFITNNK